jgi:predicted O-methyltransferase YrrM
MPPEFTSDWFSDHIGTFLSIKKELGEVNTILEIGSHEGRSTCWILQNMLSDTGSITCIDPFQDLAISAYDLTYINSTRTIEERFKQNTAQCLKSTQTLNVMPTLSFYGLSFLINARKEFDFIYIDGGHATDIVLADAVMSFGLLRPGGIMLFDDYLWDHDTDFMMRPKLSVDAFINACYKHIEVIGQGYQLAIRKKLHKQGNQNEH